MLRALAVITVSACSGANHPSPAAAPASPAASPPVVASKPAAAPSLQVELADITIDESPNVITSLQSDGSIYRERPRSPGRVYMGKLSPDGTGKPALGKPGKLQADGSYVADDREVRFRIEGQVLVIRDWHIVIQPDGTMTGVPGAFIRVTGATTPSLVRTALLVVGVMATVR